MTEGTVKIKAPRAFLFEARKLISYRTSRYLLFWHVHQYRNTSVLCRFKYWSYRTYFSRIELYIEFLPENKNRPVTKIQTNEKKYTNGKENKNNPYIVVTIDFLALVPFCRCPCLLFVNTHFCNTFRTSSTSLWAQFMYYIIFYSFKYDSSPCNLLEKLRKCGFEGMGRFLSNLLNDLSPCMLPSG